MIPARRCYVVIASALLAAVASATPATATTIGLNGGTLIFTAGSSEGGSDVIHISTSGTELTVSGYPAIDIQTSLCSALGLTVTCSLGSFNLAAFMSGSGDDVIDGTSVVGLNLFLSGGGGDDILLGGSGDDVLVGGPGDDVLIGGLGMNLLFGGDGNDVLLDGPDGGVEPPDPTLPTDPTAVPEPATLLLTGLGLAAGFARRRAKNVPRVAALHRLFVTKDTLSGRRFG